MQDSITATLTKSLFQQERTRLLAVLGEMVSGGIVEASLHMGATSLPGAPASACIDIALAVWPFPIEPQIQERLAACGYHPVGGYSGPPEQRFLHSSGAYQLFIVSAGSIQWTNFLILGDYLQHDASALQVYHAHQQAWANPQPFSPSTSLKAKAELFTALLEGARRWWIEYYSFEPVQSVADELKELGCPWFVSSGWALDLFLGRVNRVHQDIDIVIAAQDQLILQEFLTGRGWTLLTPYEKRLSPWPAHMRLELPRHQVHAHREGAFIDCLLSDIQGGVWRYRRDPAVLRSASRIGLQTPEGIPFLAPELVLLYKSKNTSGEERGKDEVDFERAWSALDPERRSWLRWALIATEPDHPWIERLA